MFMNLDLYFEDGKKRSHHLKKTITFPPTQLALFSTKRERCDIAFRFFFEKER
jgi:hypothetical protein